MHDHNAIELLTLLRMIRRDDADIYNIAMAIVRIVRNAPVPRFTIINHWKTC